MADNILRIGAEFDVSPIVAGSEQAVASFSNIEKSAIAMASELQAAGASTDQIREQMLAGGVAASTTEAAIASLGTAEVETAVATTELAGATSGLDRALAGATGRVLGMEAGMGMAGSALGRIASFLPGMGPLFQIALPIALISMAVDKITEFRDEVEKASQKAADFAVESYRTAESIEVENLKLQQQIEVLEGGPKSNNLKIALMEAQIQAEALGKSLESAIQSSVDLLNVGAFSQFFTKASGPETQFKEKLQEDINKIQEARLALAQAPPGSDAAKAAVEAQSAAYKEFGKQVDADIESLQNQSKVNQQAMTDIAQAGGVSILPTNFDESIQKLKNLKIGAQEAADSLDAMQEHSKLTAKVGGLEDVKDQSDFTEKATEKAIEEHDKLSESASKVVDSYNKLFDAEVKIQNEETQMFASSQQKDVDESIKTVQKEIDARVKYQEETAKLFEQNSLEQIRAQESTVTATASLLKTELAGVQTTGLQRIAITEQIDAQELASKEELERKKLAATMAGIEAEKAVLLGGQTEQSFVVNADPAQLSKLAALNAQIVAAQASFNGAMNAFYIQDANNEQAAQNKKVAYWQSSLNQMNTGFQNLTRQILQGNETIQRAFYQLGAGLVLSIVTSLEKMTLEYIEHKVLTLAVATSTSQTEVALTATTAAEKKTIESASTLSSLAKSAVDAAGKTWAAVAAIPIVGPFLAPEAAAGAFAGVIALGALAGAEAGAEIPHDMPIFVHSGETVAPKPLAAELHNLAPNIQKFNSTVNNSSTTSSAAQQVGGDTNVHVNFSAIDAKGVSDFIHGNRSQFLKAMKSAVRNGVRPR